MSADVLTNIGDAGPVEAWRACNAGAVVERRIEELDQLRAGRTAVDDLDGNALAWRLGAMARGIMLTETARSSYAESRVGSTGGTLCGGELWAPCGRRSSQTRRE